MDVTITLSLSDLSPGMASSALLLAVQTLEGTITLEGEARESVLSDLRAMRSKITEAQHGN